MTNKISMVIGSWGSYNECNERALGSTWLDFDDYDSWDEIVEELKRQGFELDGIDEELFVQDIEGMPANDENWDYVYPKDIFEIIKLSGVLDDQHKYDAMQAYCEVLTFDDWKKLVENREDSWDDCIYLYPDYDWDEYGRMMFQEYQHELPDELENFFDFERYGHYIGDYSGVHEYSGGIIEILE